MVSDLLIGVGILVWCYAVAWGIDKAEDWSKARARRKAILTRLEAMRFIESQPVMKGRG